MSARGGVLRHLALFLFITTFLVEGNIVLTTVQDRLVVSKNLTDIRERMDDPQSQFLSLLFLVDCDVLDMPYTAKSPQKLALHEHRPNSDNSVGCFVDDDQCVVYPRGSAHGVELCDPFGFAWISDYC